MEKLYISGGVPLVGELPVQGAKNSALPLFAAALLVKGKTVLHNCPDLTDVDAACKILNYLGCRISRVGNSVEVDASSVSRSDVPDDLMREMRSSVVFLGAIAARTHSAQVSFPGGCELGPRPIDLHLAGLRQLGLKINEEYGLFVPQCGRDREYHDCSCYRSWTNGYHQRGAGTRDRCVGGIFKPLRCEDLRRW